MIKSWKIGHLAAGSAVLVSLLLAGCDRAPAPSATTATVTPAAAVPAPPPAPVFKINWDVLDSKATSVSGDATAGYAIKVSGKAALSAVYPDLGVATGDTVKVALNVSGDEGKILRVVLIRHCEPQNGEDFGSTTIKLSAAAVPVELSHTFEHNFKCVRVSFQSAMGDAIEARVSDLVITRTKP